MSIPLHRAGQWCRRRPAQRRAGAAATGRQRRPTNTAALSATSPAIGTGNATTCEKAPINDKDQRGHKRNATTCGGCDVGAYDTGGA